METNLRQLRHNLLGIANTLVLCASAIPVACDQKDRMEFVDEIIRASDNLLAVLDQLEAMPEFYSAKIE